MACKNTVESAAGQVECCRKRAVGMPDDAGRAAVLARSEDIYRQALDNYEQARKKPWVFLSAVLMGFHHIKEQR